MNAWRGNLNPSQAWRVRESWPIPLVNRIIVFLKRGQVWMREAVGAKLKWKKHFDSEVWLEFIRIEMHAVFLTHIKCTCKQDGAIHKRTLTDTQVERSFYYYIFSMLQTHILKRWKMEFHFNFYVEAILASFSFLSL